MIRLVDAESAALRQLCTGSPFGCRILSIAGCYPHTSFSDFWVQEDEDGKPCAAISRMDGSITVCTGRTDADTREELGEFLRAVGFSDLLTPQGILRDPLPAADGAVMRLMKIIREKNQTSYVWEDAPSARELCDLFAACRGGGIDFSGSDAAYVDLAYRLRHGYSRAVALRKADGTLCTAAITTAETETDALVGGVCTLPQLRGQGMASAAVRELCTRLEREKKNIFLLAAPDRIAFYGRLGFVPWGEWEQA